MWFHIPFSTYSGHKINQIKVFLSYKYRSLAKKISVTSISLEKGIFLTYRYFSHLMKVVVCSSAQDMHRIHTACTYLLARACQQGQEGRKIQGQQLTQEDLDSCSCNALLPLQWASSVYCTHTDWYAGRWAVPANKQKRPGPKSDWTIDWGECKTPLQLDFPPGNPAHTEVLLYPVP